MSALENLHKDPDFAHYVFNLPYTLHLDYAEREPVQGQEPNLETLTKALGFDSTESCTKYLDLQIERINRLKKKYQFNDIEVETLNQVLSKQVTTLIDIQMAPLRDECDRKYRNEVIIASAAAVAGSIACAGVIPCEVAVGLGYVAAIDNANLNWHTCMRGQRAQQTTIQGIDDPVKKK